MSTNSRSAACLTIVAFCASLPACSAGEGAGQRTRREREAAAAQLAAQDLLPKLTAWMTGSFSSGAQSIENAEFRDIRLRVVPIWTDRPDGPWLYVEQAAATALDRPYRQRVYQLSRLNDGRYRSEVFEFVSDPVLYAGAWKSPTPLANLSPESLKLKGGCHVILAFQPGTGKTPDAFVGSTEGKGCPSALANAAYATSEVTITETNLSTLDRGFDASGKQVWGSTKGPYRFVRVQP